MRNKHIWLARILIGAVLLVNLDCAVAFLRTPGDYVAGFGLSGTAGEGMLRALGLLFVMWNVPYAFACYHPVKFRTSLVEALIMQAIGLAGETWILYSADYQNPAITVSVQRFILFDGAGLLLLSGAYLFSVLSKGKWISQ